MTNLQARISGVVLNRLADYGIRIDRETADSVAEAVSGMPDVAIVELPEPDYFDHWDIPSCGEFKGMESTGDSVVSVEITEDGIEPDTFGELTPLEARLFAAALLAAAIAAEVGQ